MAGLRSRAPLGPPPMRCGGDRAKTGALHSVLRASHNVSHGTDPLVATGDAVVTLLQFIFTVGCRRLGSRAS